MKKITIEFYSNDDNEDLIYNIKNEIKDLFCPYDMITINEKEIQLETEEIDENVILTNSSYRLPKIIKIEKDCENNYLFNTRRDYSKGVFNLTKKEELKEFNKVLASKSIQTDCYQLAKIKDVDNIYIVIPKTDIDEKEFLAAPYDSFVKLIQRYRQDKNYITTDKFMKFAKDIINKCGKTQKAVKEVIQFMLDYYLPLEGIININQYCELLDLIIKYEVTPTLFNAIYDSYFDSKIKNYMYRNFEDKNEKDYFTCIMKHVFKFTDDELNIIFKYATDIAKRYDFCFSINELKLANKFKMSFNELKAISKYIGKVNTDYYSSGKECIFNSVVNYSIAAAINLIRKYEEDQSVIEYEDLIKFISENLFKNYVIDNHIKINNNGTIYSYGSFSNYITVQFDYKIEKDDNEYYPLVDSVLLALENIEGRNRNKYRERFIKDELLPALNNITETDLKTYIGWFNDKYNLKQTKEAIMKVKLKVNKK